MHDNFNVLFVCRGNSVRSVFAEALLDQLGRPRFRGYSAGSEPAGSIHPLTLATLSKLKLPTDGFRSKSWAEFSAPEAPQMDFIITVCDEAAGEVCPIWPGQPFSAHWGLPDPAGVQGSDDHREQVFLDTALALKRRIELLLALPLATLDRMALHREVQAIGSR